MTTSLIEIASDVASQYPNASPEEVIEVIIDSIESQTVLSRAISYVAVPTALQIRQAEFRSKRLPKQRTRIVEHIDNARFFKKLKELYTLPVLDSGLLPIIELDGARVDLSPSTQIPSTAYEEVLESSSLNGTQLRTLYHPEDMPTTHSQTTLTQESPARNNKEIKISSSDILMDIKEKEDDSQFLSLYDVYQIINVMNFYPVENGTLNEISEIVRKDINHRNRAFKADCVKELYGGDDQLNEELRTIRPRISDISSAILEGLRAVVLNEYRRLHSQSGQKFINGETSYEYYVQTSNTFARYADVLFKLLQ